MAQIIFFIKLLSVLFFSFSFSSVGTVKRSYSCDESDSLVQYRVTFQSQWSEKEFPKQYPKSRPKAHWSNLIGRSHNDDYKLWVKGAIAEPGFKQFTQEGTTIILDGRESQGFNGIFDSFTAPEISQGVGETAADFFANHNYSKVATVSVAVRLVPSPDWFVGVDSVNLCQNGSWIKSITIPLTPMDGGTDRGFTFTSPNWASRPQEKIYRITNSFPDHRANSFYYPELPMLPPIGHLRFDLLAEHRHKISHLEVGHRREIPEGEDPAELERKREELEEQLILAGEPIRHGGQTNSFNRRSGYAHTNHMVSGGSSLNLPATNSEVEQLRMKPTQVVDCIVGSWGPWSPCSKTCGFGAQRRHRKVVQVPKGGKSCPVLEQEKWCGSMRSCNHRESMFSWLDKKTKTKTSEKRKHHGSK